MIAYSAPSLGLSLSNFRPPVLCNDCGDVIEGQEIYRYPLNSDSELSLCADCFFFRVRIEKRILDSIPDGGSASREKVFADLEGVGIDSKRGVEALQRLLRTNRLQQQGDPR